MAKAFGDTQGKAQKSSHEAYEYKDGENNVRIVGGVLPRYIYWLKNSAGKSIPVECLAFNRDSERFDNAEVDHVSKFFPEVKCSWAYVVNCIDPKDGKVKVLHLKKKLFEQIMTAAEDLGDPTDFATGWPIVFKKEKTGPLAFNITYTLQVLRCKKTPLSEEDIAKVKEAMDIDAKFPRATPAEVLATLERLSVSNEEESEASSEAESEAINELG